MQNTLAGYIRVHHQIRFNIDMSCMTYAESYTMHRMHPMSCVDGVGAVISFKAQSSKSEALQSKGFARYYHSRYVTREEELLIITLEQFKYTRRRTPWQWIQFIIIKKILHKNCLSIHQLIWQKHQLHVLFYTLLPFFIVFWIQI